MFLTFDQIIAALTAYGYFLLFPIAVLEGPIIAVLAGFLASVGIMNFWTAWGVLILGDIVGDLMFYAIGRFGRIGLINRYGHYVGITQNRILTVEKFFGNHAKKTLLLGKWTHAFGIVVLIAAGAIKENLWEFVSMNFIGTLPKSLFFLLLGYYFGSIYTEINSYLNYFTWVIVILVAVLAAAYFIITKYAKKYFDKQGT